MSTLKQKLISFLKVSGTGDDGPSSQSQEHSAGVSRGALHGQVSLVELLSLEEQLRLYAAELESLEEENAGALRKIQQLEGNEDALQEVRSRLEKEKADHDFTVETGE